MIRVSAAERPAPSVHIPAHSRCVFATCTHKSVGLRLTLAGHCIVPVNSFLPVESKDALVAVHTFSVVLKIERLLEDRLCCHISVTAPRITLSLAFDVAFGRNSRLLFNDEIHSRSSGVYFYSDKSSIAFNVQ